MVNLSINEMTTYRWSFEEDVQQYRDAGIPAIGVWRQKLSDFGEEKGIELIAEAGLRVSSLHWAGGFTGSDGRSYRDSIVDGCDAIRLASALNAACLIVYSGARGGHTNKHARRLFLGALKDLLKEAQRYDVVLAVEPMHAGCALEWTFLTDLRETLHLLNQLDSPHLRMAFDTYHLGQSPHIVSEIAAIAPRLATVHLGDAKMPPRGEPNRCCLGEGVLPLQEIVAALTESGYEGFYEVELMGEDVEASDYRELIRKSKRSFEHLLSAPNAS